MSEHDLLNNLTKDFGNSNTRTLASNSRARVDETRDGRIYVVIDGITHSADKNDLFGINHNPSEWLQTFVTEYDKEMKEELINAPLIARSEKLKDKIEKNKEKVKKFRSLQEIVKNAIKETRIKFDNFLAQCGVRLLSSLRGEKKEEGQKIRSEIYTLNGEKVSYSNSEASLLNANCCYAFDLIKTTNNINTNSLIIDSIFST